MLLVIKRSFLGKYVEKHMLCGSPLQLPLSFYFSLSAKSASALEAEKVPPFCFVNSPTSCSHTKGKNTTFPQLSQIQGEMHPRKCAPQGWAVLQNQESSLRYPRQLFSYRQKHVKRKGLVC